MRFSVKQICMHLMIYYIYYKAVLLKLKTKLYHE